MFKKIKKVLGLVPSFEEWDKMKDEGLRSVLGEQHDMVMHAIIPYAIGGTLDLYYYLNHVPGTGIVTKELIDEEGNGPSNRHHAAFELIMFTRLPLDLDRAKDEDSEFGQTHTRINRILNAIALYSLQASLNPNETCEFPLDFDHIGGACLIFDDYKPDGKEFRIGRKTFGLLLVMEIHRSEMEFARENGGAKLIERLKAKGICPYSGINRDPIV